MSHRSMTKDRTKSNALFTKHDMTVDEAASEMIERVIMRGSNQSPKRQPLGPKIKKVITHANALLRYKHQAPSSNSSIEKRRKLLIFNLDDIDVVTAIGLADVQLEPISLLEELEMGKIKAFSLEKLLRAANTVRDNKSFGRPYKNTSYIIRAAGITKIRTRET
jgi:hypothetical protein